MTPLDRLSAYLAKLHPQWRDTPWESIGEETREVFREDARGALAVLREPSPTMKRAGNDNGGWSDFYVTPEEFDKLAEECWQAMIDTALTE